MTASDTEVCCALCGNPATTSGNPPRRTFERGPDPDDPSFAVTVMLPEVMLCAGHAVDVSKGAALIGWCDDEHCRRYGQVGEPSPCGDEYKKLTPRRS